MPQLAVSVIIPTYNRAHVVGRAIRSVLAQASAEDEILVVDDGSFDATPRTMRAFGDRVRYVAIPHKGAGGARNCGVRLATRPLVAFLDSDDEWRPDKLALQRRFMERRPDVLFSFTDFTARSDNGEVHNHLASWHKDPRPWDDILAPGEWYSSLAEPPEGRDDFPFHVGSIYLAEMLSDYVALATCMVRRTIAGRALRFGEDLPGSAKKEFAARLAGAGPAAYLDCDTCWQWDDGGRNVNAVNNHDLACTRITLMERIWGSDERFLARHRESYDQKLRQFQLIKARGLMAKGRVKDARAELKSMERTPASAPANSRSPAKSAGILKRGLSKVRRAIGLGRG